MFARTLSAILAVCVLRLPALAADMPANPYAGQQARQIKALSDDEIVALQKGDGMGMAKAAELNGYPGPAHVLALGKQLSLTTDQFEHVTAIFDGIRAAAKSLGNELIERDRALIGFSPTVKSRRRLNTEITAIGEVNGRLRSLHLAAHLETRCSLSEAPRL